jgi:hypothetical protein
MKKKKPPNGQNGNDNGQESFRFDGDTFDPDRDAERLSKQLFAVKQHCLERFPGWVFLEDLAKDLGYPPTSIPALSARLRDLRKDRFGAYQVDSENVGGGLWRYRVHPFKHVA